MPPGLQIERLDPADLDLVAPLWGALLDHIAVLPGAVVPVRTLEDSWPLLRPEMEASLSGGDSFLLVARRGDGVVGYAWVKVEGPDPVWLTGDSHAELAHLSVADGERGRGVGGALVNAVDAELARLGVEDVVIGVDPANHGAVRFYERRGYRPDFTIYYGSPGNRPWACLRREAEDRAAGRGRFAPPGVDSAPATGDEA